MLSINTNLSKNVSPPDGVLHFTFTLVGVTTILEVELKRWGLTRRVSVTQSLTEAKSLSKVIENHRYALNDNKHKDSFPGWGRLGWGDSISKVSFSTTPSIPLPKGDGVMGGEPCLA